MIYAVDSIMGSGKTQAMIGKIVRDEDANKKWLYVTPYLDEVERIIKSCECKQFVQPQGFCTKMDDFRNLIMGGHNIATTHALFSKIDRKMMDEIASRGYTLVIDEVLEEITQIPVSAADDTILRSGILKEGADGSAMWTMKEYQGVFCKYKASADAGRLYLTDTNVYLAIFPYSFLKRFRDVYILTYMFDAQIMKAMLDLNHLPYEKLSAKRCGEDFELVPYSDAYDNEWYKTRLNILEHRKLNQIGDGYWDLSSSWYKRNAHTGALDMLSRNCYNFFRNIAQAKSDACMWTTFKPFVDEIGRKGFKKGFLPQNARATNRYADRTAVAYTVNQFMLTPAKMLLQNHGVNVDENAYALSNMLQFIWRSNIRQGGEIDVYVPSSRMRELLKDFSDGKKINMQA